MCCSEREPGVCFWHSKPRWRGLGLQRECETRASSVGPSNGEQSHPAVCYPRDQRSQLPTTHAPETLASCNIYPLHEPAWQRPVTQQPRKTAFNRTINPNQPLQHAGIWQSTMYYRFTDMGYFHRPKDCGNSWQILKVLLMNMLCYVHFIFMCRGAGCVFRNFYIFNNKKKRNGSVFCGCLHWVWGKLPV